MVAGARDVSQSEAVMDLVRVLAELPPLDQGVVLVGVMAEFARLQPEPSQVLALMFELARERMGQAV